MTLGWLRGPVHIPSTTPTPDAIAARARQVPAPPPEVDPDLVVRGPVPPEAAAAAAALRAYAAELPTDQASALAWLRRRSSSGALSMVRAVAIDLQARARQIEENARPLPSWAEWQRTRRGT